jgi:hypothetical protein
VTVDSLRRNPEIGAIDTIIGFPYVDLRGSYQEMLGQIRDRQTQEEFEMPVEYMFKGIPEKSYGGNAAATQSFTLCRKWIDGGVDVGLVSVGKGDAGDSAVVRFAVWPGFLRENAARVLRIDPP